MEQKIAVLDYGMGNLRSVSKALEHVAPDAEVRVTDDHEWIRAADRVVFPGQGAARDCMAAIGQHHLNREVREAMKSKPFLGICMGLQVLLTFSEENAGTELLGIFPGQVMRFAADMPGDNGMPLKIPHMGWSRVRQSHSHPLWEGIADEARFYFVHSYHVVPEDSSLVAATTDYGIEFVSAISSGNLFAVQFHPEKSADAGLRLLKNFVNWKPE
ncbi:imidazole glycerol phosphate synthase subunit HisH [Thiolapillus brandeum]|uniref:Imidazole glycerol phosphate synthase subunit HisH n=1 Tax=Thiolapillus brandeum TaxID=1076588 RepID=A0A7U6GHD4_9GAMM|nr:imidazole glycerol phosphate synthase subunit HisH [Thiolapillus brandeum]BAO43647.1 glutamine amidotransferase [Thiolapillus brandeum]